MVKCRASSKYMYMYIGMISANITADECRSEYLVAEISSHFESVACEHLHGCSTQSIPYAKMDKNRDCDFIFNFTGKRGKSGVGYCMTLSGLTFSYTRLLPSNILTRENA